MRADDGIGNGPYVVPVVLKSRVEQSDYRLRRVMSDDVGRKLRFVVSPRPAGMAGELVRRSIAPSESGGQLAGQCRLPNVGSSAYDENFCRLDHGTRSTAAQRIGVQPRAAHCRPASVRPESRNPTTPDNGTTRERPLQCLVGLPLAIGWTICPKAVVVEVGRGTSLYLAGYLLARIRSTSSTNRGEYAAAPRLQYSLAGLSAPTRCGTKLAYPFHSPASRSPSSY
jgi:hypothetical protein